MNATTATLSAALIALFLINAPAAQAQDLSWENHYSKAERAYAQRNLFAARHHFMVALKEAKNCQQDRLLAERVEHLASSYQSQDQAALAAPLVKLAQKLRSNLSTI